MTRQIADRFWSRTTFAGLGLAAAAHAAIAQPAPAADAATAAIAQEIMRREAEGAAVRAGLRRPDPNAQGAPLPGTLFINSSGWLLDRAQMAELAANTRGRPPARNVIKTGISDQRVTVYNKDTAISTFISETYYEVPNPQLVAERQGILTEDPAAMAKVAAAEALRPREPAPPNPYRVRTTHVWVLDGGDWKIAHAQATPVTERIHAGR